MEGVFMDKPDILYQAKVRPDDKGNIRNRGVLKDPFSFTDWLFVYSTGRQKDRDDRDADEAVRTLTKAAQTYGIKFKEPGFITADARNWKN